MLPAALSAPGEVERHQRSPERQRQRELGQGLHSVGTPFYSKARANLFIIVIGLFEIACVRARLPVWLLYVSLPQT